MASKKPLGNMVVELDLNSSAFGKGLDGAKKAVTSSMKSMKSQMKIMDASGDKMGKLEAKQSGLTRTIEAQEEEVRRLQDAYDNSFDSNGNATEATAQYANKLNDAQGRLASYRKQLSDVGQEIASYKKQLELAENPMYKAGQSMENAGNKMQGFGSNMMKVGGKISGFGNSLTNHITKPIMGIGTALGGLTLGLGMKRLVGIDDAKAKLEALGNSTEEVDEIMQNADKAIEGTSMRLDETATVAASASAAGVDAGEDLTRYLGLTADAASVAGTSMSDMGNVLNKATTQGKAQNDILQQMSEQGLPVYQWLGEEANKAGDEIFQMASDGEISTEMLLDAIEKNIGGAAQIMGEKSFTSALQNMSTYLGHVGAAFLDGKGEGKGFFSAIKPLMVDFSEYLQSITPKAEELGEKFGQSFTGMIGKLKEAKAWYDDLSNGQQELFKKVAIFGPLVAATLGPALIIFGKLATGVGAVVSTFGGLTSMIGSAMKGIAGISGVVANAGGVFGILSKAVGAVLSPIKFLGTLFMAITSPIGILVTAVTGIGIALIASANKSKSFSEIFQGMVEGIKNGIGLLIQAGKIIKNIISPNIDSNETALDMLKNMFGEETGEAIFSSLMTIKNMITEAINSIVNFFMEQADGIIKFWNENGEQIIQALSNLWSVIWPMIKGAFAIIVGIVSSAWDAMKTIIDGGVTVIEGIIQVFSGLLTGDFYRMWEGIKNIFSGAIKLITGWIQLSFIRKIVSGIGNMAKSAGSHISNMWTSIKNFFINGIRNVKNFVSTFISSFKSSFNNMRASGANIIKSMWTAIRNTFSNAIKAVWGYVKQFATNIGKRFGLIRSDGTNIFSKLWSSIRNLFSNGIANVKRFVQNFYNNTIGKFKSVRNQGGSVMKALWETIKGVFRNGKTFVVNLMKKLPGDIKNAILKGKNLIGNAFKKIFGTAVKFIKKPVNAIIGGASWILEKFGADKLEEWKPDVSEYARGTSKKGHKGGNALVNDGRGAEAVIPPGGQPFIPRGKNVFMPDMPRGTHVLNAKETAEAYGKKRPTFKYAKGTGIWDTIKNTGAKAWEGTKNLAKKAGKVIGDIWDYATNPKKLVNKVVKHFVPDFSDDAAAWPLKMGKSFVGKAKDTMFDWVKGLFDEYGSMGEFDGKMDKSGKWKVYNYLWDVAQKVMDKYPGMSGVTSGYRPGDPNYHGKHQAIDIAYPASMNGSKKYTEAGNWAFSHFPDQLAYVIANNKIKDRTGMGGEGVTNAWKRWPGGGHLNHMHLNGKYGPGDVGKGGDGFDGGSGVGRWKKTAIKALKMTGDYTKSNLSALMAQMKAESNGNPKAVNNWDSNAARGTPSKGLMQMIQPTFDSYKMKGHGNILKPLDNILAAIRYTKSAYGSLKSGWRGAGYENGGLVSRHQIAEIGEGNKPEMVLPLTNKARSLELMGQAMRIMGMNNNSTTSGTSYDDADLIALLIEQHKETVSVLKAIASKDTTVDADSLTDYTNDRLGKQLKRLGVV